MALAWARWSGAIFSWKSASGAPVLQPNGWLSQPQKSPKALRQRDGDAILG